jgi:hypothetical protein
LSDGLDQLELRCDNRLAGSGSATDRRDAGLRFEADWISDADLATLQDDRQYASPTKDFFLQTGDEGVHFLTGFAVAGNFQRNVVIGAADEEDVTLSSVGQIHPGYGDIFLDLSGFQTVAIQRFFVHDQDLAQITRVSTSVTLQPFCGNGAGRVHGVGRSALNAGDVKIDDAAGLH